MEKESLNFLKDLLSVNGPSGFETDPQGVWLMRTEKYADSVERDVHGNATAVLNTNAKRRVMLAGHADEIGFIVTHIADSGMLHVACVGGIDTGVLPGSQVQVRGKKGWMDGIIGKKPIHLMTPDERSKVLHIKELWVDIGAKDKKDAEKVVSVGDPVAYKPNFMMLKNNLFTSKACDNRTGAFVASEVMKILSKKKDKLKVAVHSVSTVQEEIGIRGAATAAYGIDPDVGIAIDVGFASDTPSIDKRLVGDVTLGKGPILHAGANINPNLAEIMEKVAKKQKIPTQMSAEPGATGSDANALQMVRAGAAATLVSVPNRYMHTMVETCSLDDLTNTAKLVAETILTITNQTSFIPK